MIAQVSAEAFHPHDNKGKGNGHPVVPEVETYGAILMAAMLIAIIAKRYWAWRSIK